MKRMVTASVENPKQLPITKLTEDELFGLPQKVTLKTRRPGASYYIPVFQVVDKEKIAADPDKCLLVDSYWGWASGRDVYLASRKDIEEERKRQIEAIEKKMADYRRYAL